MKQLVDTLSEGTSIVDNWANLIWDELVLSWPLLRGKRLAQTNDKVRTLLLNPERPYSDWTLH